MGCSCTKAVPLEEVSGDYVQVKDYIGEKNCLGQKNGHGQYYFDNGDVYDGQWRRNKKHGYGKYTFADGDCRTGYFVNDDYYGKAPPPGMSSHHEVASPNSPLPPVPGGPAGQPAAPLSQNPETAYNEALQARLLEVARRDEERRIRRSAKVAEIKEKYNIKT